MRPGITISHARSKTVERAVVRSDVCGFIGIIPKGRWPNRAQRGDFVEMPVGAWADFAGNKVSQFFDPVTRLAVCKFFENGGLNCKVFGLCVESEQDLMSDDPFDAIFHPLVDRLQGEEDLALLAMPVLAYLPTAFTKRGAEIRCQPILEILLEHCRRMNNRFLIIDAPRDVDERSLAKWIERFRTKNQRLVAFGALYFPWLQNGDEVFPPSGAVAGCYARSDNSHAPFGVRWPPANIQLHGVTHPAVPVAWKDTGTLVEASINPILTQAGKGVMIWGARTLSDDPKWKFVNSRRIVSFIAEQLRRDSEWVVFEHQRPQLWETISRMVKSRLDSFWNAGLLTGEQPGTEYLVQCDAMLNPPEVRDAGQVHVKVVLRPVSTAEYIEVELQLGI